MNALRHAPVPSSAPAQAGPARPDAELLRRLRAGDGAAFEAWVRAETPRLVGTARRILRNEEDARDAVQEAFLHAFRGLAGFAGQSRLSTWLHRIVVNAALMQLRRRRRDAEEPIEPLLPRFSEDGHRLDPGPRWPALEDDAVDRAELRRVLEACYARLPERFRLILLLRDVEGLDTAETAQLLGIGRDAVKMRLHRARQALRTLLEPYVLDGRLPGGGPPRTRPGRPAAAPPAR